MCIRFLISLGCALCCCSICYAQENRALLERFLTEAPEAWEQFHKRAARLQGAYSVEAVFEGKTVGKEKEEFRQTEGCALLLHQTLVPENVKGRQIVANPRYAFELRRGDDTKSWAVSSVEMVGDKGRPQASSFAEIERLVNAPITLFMVSDFEPEEYKGALRTIVKEPGFSLKKISEQEPGGNDWVRIEFTYHPKAKSRRVPSIVTGWALLDPQRNWSIQEDQCDLEWGVGGERAIFASKFHYEGSQDRFPLLKRIEMTHTYPKTLLKRQITVQFDLREGDAAVAEFTLTAFGFPEPVGVTWPKPTKWWLWISLGSAATVGIALVLLMLKRRYFDFPAPAEVMIVDTKVGRP